MSDFLPFADDETTFTLGSFTAENGQDRIAVYGNLDLTRDKEGLSAARALKSLLDNVVAALEGVPDLPEKLAPLPTPATPDLPNPFG